MKKCDECEAILRAWREARTFPMERRGDLAEFLARLDSGELARTRLKSPQWAVWRRAREHQALTGHVLTLSGVRCGQVEPLN